MSVNKATLVGNLGNNPELRFSGSGKPVCNFRMATNERWKDKDGNKQESTEWHRIVVWGAMAEACAEYLSSGRQVYVEGKLQTRTWTPDDGKQRFTTEIIASNVVFLGTKAVNEARTKETSGVVPEATIEDPVRTQEAQQTFGDEDVPF